MMMTVLVVSEDHMFLNDFRDVLEIEGYRALIADTLDEALKLAEHYDPDVILYESRHRERNGQDLVRALRTNGLLATIPVVVVGNDEAIAGQADIVRAFIKKPFDVPVLLEALVSASATARDEREAERRALRAAGVPGQTRLVLVVPARISSSRDWYRLAVYMVHLKRTPKGAHDDDGLPSSAAHKVGITSLDKTIPAGATLMVEAQINGLEVEPASVALKLTGDVARAGFAVRLTQPFYANLLRGSVVGSVGGQVVFDLPVEIPLRVPAEMLSPPDAAAHTLSPDWQQTAQLSGGALLHPHKDVRWPIPQAQEGKHRILVIDDEIGALTLIGIMLERIGFAVFKARDGSAALAMLEELVPDLILVDGMLSGLNTFDLIRSIRSREDTRQTPILVLSSRGDADTIVRAVEAGANDYLLKPILHYDLAVKVRQMIDDRPSNAENPPPRPEPPLKLHASEAAPQPDPPLSASSGTDVLVLHQDHAKRAAVVKVLQRAGYGVSQAESIDMAFTLLKQESFDLVMMNVRFPAGDLTEAIRKLKAHNPDMSIVLLTGFASLRLAIDGLTSGATDYLIEPSSTDDIRQAVHTALNRARKLRQRRALLTHVQQHDALLAELAAADAVESRERTLAACRMLARFGARRGADLPIIIATRNVDDDLPQRALEAGALSCISLDDVTSAARTVAVAASSEAAHGRVRILLVEGADAAQSDFDWLLRQRTYAVKRVESAVEALRALQRKLPALVILAVDPPASASM